MIPDYQTLMFPILSRISDGREHRVRDIIESLAIEFSLSEAERKELLASGVQPVFENRVGWAKTYLKKAGLIEQPKRAVIQISNSGLELLTSGVSRIDAKSLRRYPSFLDFQSGSKIRPGTTDDVELPAPERTPEETLDDAYEKVRSALAAELLSKVVEMTPSHFERFVVELLVQMGYGGSMSDAGRAIGRTGDEGIDGTIKEDRLGLDVIYIQAKRWKPGNTVGRPEIQKFVGALAGQGAKKGIFITTSSFSKEALEYMPRNETKIVLIDGAQLATLMVEFNVGCSTHRTYHVKKMDSDFFDED